MQTKMRWTHIDVDTAASRGQFPRSEAVRKLQEWNDRGAIELQPAGVINRFKILKTFPHKEDEKQSIIQAVYKQIEEREKSDMERVQQVVNLITNSGCISRRLATHFGDEESIPVHGCGHCSYCIDKTSAQYLHCGVPLRQQRAPIDESKIKAILAATKARDDARYLARVAFGISSPRVTIEKLAKHNVFGSMADCDFEVSHE